MHFALFFYSFLESSHLLSLLLLMLFLYLYSYSYISFIIISHQAVVAAGEDGLAQMAAHFEEEDLLAELTRPLTDAEFRVPEDQALALLRIPGDCLYYYYFKHMHCTYACPLTDAEFRVPEEQALALLRIPGASLILLLLLIIISSMCA